MNDEPIWNGFQKSSDPFMLDGIPHIKMSWVTIDNK